jgi:hypothetical protein
MNREKLPRNRKHLFVAGLRDDGSIVETLYRPAENQTAFCIWDGTRTQEATALLINGEEFSPYPPSNNLLKNNVVLFPTIPEEYGTEEQLLTEVRAFIHRYVDLSPTFEEIAVHYVLFTWVYDVFEDLPYLRVRGDFGTGKSRFLLIVGSICYRPIFASGAATASPLFRILEEFGGTLIIDESDFRASDEKTDLVKILNSGTSRGFPVLRSEVTPQGEFNPRSYQVYGPKIVASRGYFEDRALESRFLTEDLGTREIRPEIPVNLPSTYREEALKLRNKLLLYRFRNRHAQRLTSEMVDRTIDLRLNQIFVPLLSTISNTDAREAVLQRARAWQAEMAEERGAELEARILEVIRDLLAAGEPQISVKAITNWLVDRHGEEYEHRLTPKWVGHILRRKLRLQSVKRSGNYVLPASEFAKLSELYNKYHVEPSE